MHMQRMQLTHVTVSICLTGYRLCSITYYCPNVGHCSLPVHLLSHYASNIGGCGLCHLKKWGRFTFNLSVKPNSVDRSSLLPLMKMYTSKLK